MAKLIILISIIVLSKFLNHAETAPVLNQDEQYVDIEVNEIFFCFKKSNLHTYKYLLNT